MFLNQDYILTLTLKSITSLFVLKIEKYQVVLWVLTAQSTTSSHSIYIINMAANSAQKRY